MVARYSQFNVVFCCMIAQASTYWSLRAFYKLLFISYARILFVFPFTKMITRSKKKQLNSPQNRRLRITKRTTCIDLKLSPKWVCLPCSRQATRVRSVFSRRSKLRNQRNKCERPWNDEHKHSAYESKRNDSIYYQNDYWSAMMIVITIKLIALPRKKKKCFQSRLLNQISMFHQS